MAKEGGQMQTSVISAEGLTKTYRGVLAVDGVSFEVGRGTVTAFLGPNGAGKTTTIRMLLGLTRPDRGAGSVLGKPLGQLDRPLSEVGVFIDGSGFHPARTARDHLRVLAAAGGVGRARVDEVLETVGLTGAADRRVGKFSLGMRQRLGLAGALLGDPDVLILDEPANGLDPAGIRWLRGFLRSYAASGRTVFVSSHVLSEVAQLAGEVIVLHHGRVVTQTTVDRLVAEHSVAVRTREPERLRRALLTGGATVRAGGDGRLEVAGVPIERVGEIAAIERLVLYELTPRTASLEDVFLQLTNDGSDRGDIDERAA
jgi:ABC-2 type transport system ATP-binding protein